MTNKIKILYISPGPVPLETNRNKNKFYFLSERFSGDVLSPVWGKKGPKTRRMICDGNNAVGKFKWHTTFSFKYPQPLRLMWDVLFYLAKGLQLYFLQGSKFDVIVTYGFLKTGLAGYILKIFTGRKLIIELQGNLRKGFIYEDGNKKINSFKQKLNRFWGPLILNRADHLKILYPLQLSGYSGIKNKNVTSFHDFVPISIIKKNGAANPYILFMGYPWFLKGVDILIRAFNIITENFPGIKLKIVGFCPDKSYFAKLAGQNKNIEFLEAVFHEGAMEMMAKCYLFVLPSRTEAMGRVLLEAMAMSKPIIASNVDGIPYYIKNGYNGLLFETENYFDLAEKIGFILRNEEYARQLGRNGYEYVQNNLSEKIFVEKYFEMVNRVLTNRCWELK